MYVWVAVDMGVDVGVYVPSFLSCSFDGHCRSKEEAKIHLQSQRDRCVHWLGSATLRCSKWQGQDSKAAVRKWVFRGMVYPILTSKYVYDRG